MIGKMNLHTVTKKGEAPREGFNGRDMSGI
jgi:hypothetical protein